MDMRLAQRIRPKINHVMYQTWRNLLFLHWEADPAMIQATLPAGLTVDTFEGKAYIGIVPFYMEAIRPRFLPAVPKISWFLETNMRTYVYDENGKPGVWFYSLDCDQPLAVWTARALFRLPYFHAKMSAPARKGGQRAESSAGMIEYRTLRKGVSAETQSYFAHKPIGDSFFAQPGTLEFFLAERYQLFAETRQGLASGQVVHTPYELFSAEVSAFDTHIFAQNQLPVPLGEPVSALFSPGVTVDIFPLSV